MEGVMVEGFAAVMSEDRAVLNARPLAVVMGLFLLGLRLLGRGTP